MDCRVNNHGQAVGAAVTDVSARNWPSDEPMIGAGTRLDRLQVEVHGNDLWSAFAEPVKETDWTYLAYGPFYERVGFDHWLTDMAEARDPQFFVVSDLAASRALGVASFMRIEPASASLEVGHIHFSASLQRSSMATEAMYLMMRRAFDELGYRRYEWKCDALNARSRRAAERLGFQFEGVFRQATYYKGRNRDTAWYSVIDSEWPRLKAGFEHWLKPSNFDSNGEQKTPLGFDL